MLSNLAKQLKLPSFGSPSVAEDKGAHKKSFEDFRAYQDYKGEPLIIFSSIQDS